MGEGDHIPGGSQKRKADPAYIKKMIESRGKAEEIRKKTMAEHQQNDVPAASAQLDTDLEELFKSN